MYIYKFHLHNIEITCRPLFPITKAKGLKSLLDSVDIDNLHLPEPWARRAHLGVGLAAMLPGGKLEN